MSLVRASLSFLHSHGFILRNALSYSQRTVASVWCALYCHWREKKETGIQEETWTKMYYCQVFKLNELISPLFLQVWNEINKLAWNRSFILALVPKVSFGTWSRLASRPHGQPVSRQPTAEASSALSYTRAKKLLVPIHNGKYTAFKRCSRAHRD